MVNVVDFSFACVFVTLDEVALNTEVEQPTVVSQPDKPMSRTRIEEPQIEKSRFYSLFFLYISFLYLLFLIFYFPLFLYKTTLST
jgi:hypothetical protein